MAESVAVRFEGGASTKEALRFAPCNGPSAAERKSASSAESKPNSSSLEIGDMASRTSDGIDHHIKYTGTFAMCLFLIRSTVNAIRYVEKAIEAMRMSIASNDRCQRDSITRSRELH